MKKNEIEFMNALRRIGFSRSFCESVNEIRSIIFESGETQNIRTENDDAVCMEAYSDSIFESVTTENDKRLLLKGLMRYENDRSGKQFENDLRELVSRFAETTAKKNNGMNAKRNLADMSNVDFAEIIREYNNNRESNRRKTKAMYMLDKYIEKKIPNTKSELKYLKAEADEVANKLRNFIKKEIIKREADREREETYKQVRETGVYDMDSPGSGYAHGNLSELLAEHDDKYGSKSEADASKQS